MFLVYYKMGVHPWGTKQQTKKTNKIPEEWISITGCKDMLLRCTVGIYSVSWHWRTSLLYWLLLENLLCSQHAAQTDSVELWSPQLLRAMGLWCVQCLCARYVAFLSELFFSWLCVCGGSYICQYWVCVISQTSAYLRSSRIVLNSRQFRFTILVCCSYKLAVFYFLLDIFK